MQAIEEVKPGFSPEDEVQLIQLESNRLRDYLSGLPIEAIEQFSACEDWTRASSDTPSFDSSALGPTVANSAIALGIVTREEIEGWREAILEWKEHLAPSPSRSGAWLSAPSRSQKALYRDRCTQKSQQKRISDESYLVRYRHTWERP